MVNREAYTKFVEDMWVTKHEPLDTQISIAGLGIGGESGELLMAIMLNDPTEITYELGDILFYVFTLSRLLEIPIPEDRPKLWSSGRYSTSYNKLIVKACKVQEHIKKHLRNKSKNPINKEYISKLFRSIITNIDITADLYGKSDLEDVVNFNYRKLSKRGEEGTISDVLSRTHKSTLHFNYLNEFKDALSTLEKMKISVVYVSDEFRTIQVESASVTPEELKKVFDNVNVTITTHTS